MRPRTPLEGGEPAGDPTAKSDQDQQGPGSGQQIPESFAHDGAEDAVRQQKRVAGPSSDCRIGARRVGCESGHEQGPAGKADDLGVSLCATPLRSASGRTLAHAELRTMA